MDGTYYLPLLQILPQNFVGANQWVHRVLLRARTTAVPNRRNYVALARWPRADSNHPPLIPEEFCQRNHRGSAGSSLF